MRRHGKVDGNQKEIVQALRQSGCSVFITSDVGQGFPDLVVARHGVTYLLELKDGTLAPSKQKLTPMEQEFRDGWHGPVFTVNSIHEALATLGIVSYRATGD